MVPDLQATMIEIGRLCAAWAVLEAESEAALWGILDLDSRVGPILSSRLEMRSRWELILKHAPTKHKSDIPLLKKLSKDITIIARDRNIVVHGLIHAEVLRESIQSKEAAMEFVRPPCWSIFRGSDAGKLFPVSPEAVRTIRANMDTVSGRVAAFNHRHRYESQFPSSPPESDWPKPIE